MIKKLYVITAILISIAVMFACQKRVAEIEPEGPDFTLKLPAYFPKPKYSLDDNRMTNEGFVLGRLLFYDDQLSSDKKISCGSCHQQFAAFAHLDHPISHGVEDRLGRRNAPGLTNLIWQDAFFWDGGAKNLEATPLNALTDFHEMNMTLDAVLAYLNANAKYKAAFKQVFQRDEIDSQMLLKALSQFMARMVSANSKYDQVVLQKTGLQFTEAELKGYNLFKSKCASCHSEPLFTNLQYDNNGIKPQSTDKGRMEITNLASDYGKFRVPSLRNVAFTGPYMHDGRYYNLDAVLMHYAENIEHSAALNPSLNAGIPLNAEERHQIKSFLNTLTDHEFIQNKIFAQP